MNASLIVAPPFDFVLETSWPHIGSNLKLSLAVSLSSWFSLMYWFKKSLASPKEWYLALKAGLNIIKEILLQTLIDFFKGVLHSAHDLVKLEDLSYLDLRILARKLISFLGWLLLLLYFFQLVLWSVFSKTI